MYKALYRKYRPKNFKDLVGQEHITKILENQIATSTISHAYLFSGTRGTGKTSCAKIFSRAINCTSSDTKPCNKCENCLESLDGSSIDIIEIDAASNNGVDNIRDLKDRAFYQPTSLKYKVYIIDEVHMLSKGAFNALLKILEEPPAHLIFILATTEPERIPLTILSRCQKFQFKRINFKSMEKALKEIGEKEEIYLDDDTYNLIINNADGSMRDAQSVMEQLFSSGRDRIDYDYATRVLGIADISSIARIIDNIIDNQASGLLESLDEILLSGKDTEQLGKDLLSHFRKIMLAKVSKDSLDRFINVNQEIFLRQAERISLSNILQSMNKLINQLNEIKYSQQKRALLEIGLIEILNLVNSEEKRELTSYSNTSPNRQEGKPHIDNSLPVERKDSISLKDLNTNNINKNEVKKIKQDNSNINKDNISKKNILTLEQISGDWNDILHEIKLKKVSLHAMVIESTLLAYKDNTLNLGFYSDYNFHKNKVMETANRELLENVISMFYNEKVKINAVFIDVETDSSIEQDIKTLTDLVGEKNIKIM